MDITTLVIAALAALLGGGGSYAYLLTRQKTESARADEEARRLTREAQEEARRITESAEQRAQHAEKRSHEAEEVARKIVHDAKTEAHENRKIAEKILEDARRESTELTKKLESVESRLAQKESILEKKLDELDGKRADLERKQAEIAALRDEAEGYREQQKKQLEEVAHLTREDAQKRLIEEVERDSEQELVLRIRKGEERAKEEAEKRAAVIIGNAIQRMAGEVTHATTITAVQLPNEEMKGKIIGREGRNITALEMATGVDIIVDDSPGAVLISGFDLVRREIAKQAITELVKDGRIQPARIEEEVAKANKRVEATMVEMGEKALAEVGALPLPPEVVKILGRLHFRTSYGQNNLRHSIEVAFVGGLLAGQLGIDVKLAKTAALLHDLGKAVDHEVEGPHAVIGANILRKFGVDPRIIHAVEAHHEDIPMETALDYIVHSADAISGARPGARRESLEAYIQRLKELENIALSFEGVKKAYAIAAGREVRVFVNPADTNDLKTLKTARDIAKKIEQDMNYPGQIKVLVIRESRAVEYAK